MHLPEKEAPQDDASAADSVITLEGGLRSWAFWMVALTSVWMFVLMILLKKLRWYQGSILFNSYPVACLGASIAVLKSARPTKLFFAALNFLSALAWGAFILWIVSEFKRHPWK